MSVNLVQPVPLPAATTIPGTARLSFNAFAEPNATIVDVYLTIDHPNVVFSVAGNRTRTLPSPGHAVGVGNTPLVLDVALDHIGPIPPSFGITGDVKDASTGILQFRVPWIVGVLRPPALSPAVAKPRKGKKRQKGRKKP